MLQRGASAKLTAALTLSTTHVSLSAFRALENEFLVDADVTELDLLSSHVHERQHPLQRRRERQRPYALLGARARYGPANRRWSINVYARNLTGADYIMAAFATSPAAYGGRPGAPTQFGVQLELRR